MSNDLANVHPSSQSASGPSGIPSAHMRQNTAAKAGHEHEPISRQYLTFNTSGECYALGILSIKEIIEFGNITKVPLVPLFVRGVINLRGAVVPVIDLSARLYGHCISEGKRTCVVIVEINTPDGLMELGIVVDAVNEVLELSSTDLSQAPNFGSRIRTDFIEAMARINEKLVMVLALDKVLSIEEMSALVALREQGATDL
jgi:purine-binding chemotaxis protein CheW